ncbi:MAG TPA: hypothetical protein VJU61_02875, partial [Polyangiaceae bacterium]|nr:hypothetical protein [Polyangiaceae bacterium]
VSKSTFVVDAFMSTLQRPVANAANIGVNANVALGGSGSVDGELRVVGQRVLAPGMQVDAVLQVPSPPCRCEPELLLDIAALVRAHRSDHDNARAGVSESELDGYTAPKELSLPCGRYYFTRLKSEASLTIRTRGNVVIFVENSIELGDALRIQTEDSAGQVNVFVGGEARVTGSLWLGGDPNGRSRVNLYLQGEGTLDLGASTEIVGQLYAPHALLVNRGTLKLYGSMFVERAQHDVALQLHYDTSTATPAQCDP